MNMVEVKTAELSGRALDWAVAEAEGFQCFVSDEFGIPRWIYRVNESSVRVMPKYSSDWSQGGPLLDRHCKSFGCVQDGRDGTWRAFGYGSGEAFDPTRTMRIASGPSILVAACRAIVSAKLGDTVQVPAELVQEPRHA